MKKTTFFKMFLVMAGLCAGSSVWADAGDVTTNANIDFSNAISEGTVAGTINSMTIGGGSYITTDNSNGWLRLVETGDNVVTIPEAQRAKSKDVVVISFKMAWGNKSKMGSQFSINDANGDAIASFYFGRNGVTASNTLGIDMSNLYGSAYNNAPIYARYTSFTITINYAAKTISTVVAYPYGNKSETFNVSLTNTNPVATFKISGFGVGGNTDRADAFDDLLIQTTEADYSVVTYDYTVNWVCGGSTVKSAIRQGESGSSIALSDSDKDPFWVNSNKYFYVSDDVSGKTVAEDNSTSVTVTVREAEVWNYTVKAVDEDENVLGTILSQSVVEGESVFYYYPTFFLNGTDLLQADINSKTYGKSATPATDNEVFNVTYKNNSISNIVFYKECEEIEGLTATSDGNVKDRCSNGKGAFATSNTVITSLASGKYKIYGFAWGGSGTVFRLTANSNEVATFTTASSTVSIRENDEFELMETTDIILNTQGNQGSSPKVIDFIYIQRTGDATTTISTTIGTTGYSTFASAYALNLSSLPEGLTAYYASAVGTNSVTLTQATGNVVAGEGLILKGTANATYSIPVVASGEAIDGNKLVGCTAATDLTTPNANYYVLANKGGDAEFQSLSGEYTDNKVTIPAGKAYLNTAGAGAKLRVIFADDASGIEEIATEVAESGVIYNLAGQAVTADYKGIVIKNGKKYLNQ